MGIELLPDDLILSTMFPTTKPKTVTVLANNFQTCTFRVFFDTSPMPDVPKDLVVRMEAKIGKLQAIAALQEIAHMQIPELMAKTYSFGKATTSDKREVEYTVSEFVPDTVTLESVWLDLLAPQKETLVRTVAEALKRLQTQQFSVDTIQQTLTNTPWFNESGTSLVGSTSIGYFHSVAELLVGFQGKVQPAEMSTRTSKDGQIETITVHPTLGGAQDIVFSSQDLQALDRSVVLSHNDVEPRNLLVRRIPTEDASSSSLYELVAIVDWEMAGFLPFAFETAWKDSVLGSCNLYYDFYAMFKDMTKGLVQPGEASKKLVRAVHILTETREQARKKNVSAEFRRRWMKQKGLKWSEDPLVGWSAPSDDNTASQFSREQNSELETQILKDFGYIT